MKTKLSTLFVLAAGLLAVGARAQVASTPALDNSATAQPSQIVYTPRLPSAAELSNVAAAQGLTIDKIVQTTSQMTLVYRTANGQTNVVAYMLLPGNGRASNTTDLAQNLATVAQPATPAPQVVIAQQAPAPQVVYYSEPAPTAAYYYSPYYYPSAYYSPWYTPVALSVGFGLGYYGGYHGGWHGGGYHGGGGWHGGHH